MENIDWLEIKRALFGIESMPLLVWFLPFIRTVKTNTKKMEKGELILIWLVII